MTTLPDRLRSRFPILERKTYVNSCSQGALSDAVRAAYGAYLADRDDEGSPWELWVEKEAVARASFADLGGRVVTPEDPDRRGPLVAIAATDAPALVAALAEDGVVASSRDGNLRVSPHLYNSAEDVEAVLRSLARSRHLLRG